MNAQLLVALLVVGLAGAPLTAIAGWRRPRLAAAVAVVSAALSLLMVIATQNAGGGSVTLPWAPTLGLSVALTFDGISAVYGLLATGIGAIVLAYSAGYIPRHLRHAGRDPNEATTFYALILLFMGAMVGMVVADDLFLLFIFWDLTAVVSYFLIGFDREEPTSRPAALMALFITAGSAILMLAGIVLLWMTEGTSAIQTLNRQAPGSTMLTISVVLIAIAALAKSAQVPLHFWLPRAMVAPTPVSAYLHSAAMVAAGVFLLARLLPLVHRAAGLPEAMTALGFASILVGGILALSRDEMKRVLAYSTIGQYGYVVVMLGVGGAYGATGAALYVLAHGLAKCALFLTAGAVTEATGEKHLSRLGGLLREMPVLAVASGVAAAAIAAIPLSIGFFKDELFFATLNEEGTLFTVVGVLCAGLTFAYIGRFWISLFLGQQRSAASRVPISLVGPIVVLAALCIIGGIWTEPERVLAVAGGTATLGVPAPVEIGYHLDTRPENVMAVAAYGLGVLMLVTLRWWASFSRWLAGLGERLGPDRFYVRSVESLNAFSDRLHGYEVHDLRGRVAWVLLPIGVLVLLGLLFTPNEGAFLVGTIGPEDLLIVLVLGVACVAAVTTTFVTGHLSSVLLLSAVGFPLATTYAFLGSPDVALVAVLMETMLSLLFIGFLSAMREHPTIEGVHGETSESILRRDRIIGVIAAATAFVVVWGVLSKPAPIESAAMDLIALTPSAHASDVVTAILSDFRGLDTMGEITVIGIAMIGLLTILQQTGRRRSRE
jgi:multicomponent Na+:H+ antiporter subunit A